ncbi:hypothetical protein HDU76_001238 [Blyttiomyces sp. JEL0837]|nr:hypothetical protein HDU76_001238 [Blyttiomyces sp. JEL0837]
MVIKTSSVQASSILTSAVTTITILSIFSLFTYNTKFGPDNVMNQRPSQHRPAISNSHNPHIGGNFQTTVDTSLPSSSIHRYLTALRHLSFIHNINHHERHIYSQYNEDGVIEYIFDNIGVTDKYYVEFGTETCAQCTTRHLWDLYGWDGLLMDGSGKSGDSRVIQNHFFTRENIVDLFRQHKVPMNYDFMTVDVDQNEFHLAKAVLDAGYRPNVLILEINRNFGPKDSYVSVYDSQKLWQSGPYFGQSPLAATRLATSHGYVPVYYDHVGVNMYYILIERLQTYLYEKTGEMFTADEIVMMTPTFEMVYRRQNGIHVANEDLKVFYKEFPKYDWDIVDESGEISGRLKATA